MPDSSFLFTVCQRGAEAVLKQEVARLWPDFRFAYSRPGFVTFRLPDSFPASPAFDLRCAFARTFGYSLGKIRGDKIDSLATEVWQLVGDRNVDHLHVWERDAAEPGHRGFEPGITARARDTAEAIAGHRPSHVAAPQILCSARSGERIVDCVMVEPNEWWIGYHQAKTVPSRWPGGTPLIELPEEAISRAYLKAREALLWSRLPISAGDQCVEIGSSPGGSCQALLEAGLRVTGIDPADMAPALLAEPRFTHVRARGADLKRREFRKTKWLVVDSNVAPKHTLDTVEHIVTNRQVEIRGLLLTLKLPDWRLAELIPDYLQRVQGWGYRRVRARQLAFNRQEICVAALR